MAEENVYKAKGEKDAPKASKKTTAPKTEGSITEKISTRFNQKRLKVIIGAALTLLSFYLFLAFCL